MTTTSPTATTPPARGSWRWWRDLAIGVVATAAFAGFGLWILIWSIGTMGLSSASTGWPTVPGQVIESWLDERGEPEPHVVYEYAVDGGAYRSGQLGFDVFDKPGGRGGAATRVARYPVGAAVTVYVDPDRPERAVLEPGDLSPFGVPLMFGGLFLAFGGLMGFRTLGHGFGAGPVVLSPAARARIVGLGTAALVAIVLVVVSFDSAVREVQREALGGVDGPLPTVVFLALQAVAFLPIPWVLVNLVRVNAQAAADGRPIGGLLSLLLALPRLLAAGGDAARSARIVIGGLLWVALWIGGWIAFASFRGL